MPEIWTLAKQLAWSAYLLTVTSRYVAACACSNCNAIRWRFEAAYAQEQQRALRTQRKVAV